MPYLSREQASRLQKISLRKSAKIRIKDFADTSDRTLTLSSNYNDTVFLHIYIQYGQLNIHLYEETDGVVHTLEHQASVEISATSLSPKRKAIPQFTDLEFANLMLFAETPIQFKKYGSELESPTRNAFYGEVFEGDKTKTELILDSGDLDKLL